MNGDARTLPVLGTATLHHPQEGGLDCLVSPGSCLLSTSRLSFLNLSNCKRQRSGWKLRQPPPPLTPRAFLPPLTRAHAIFLQHLGQSQGVLGRKTAGLGQGPFRLLPGHWYQDQVQGPAGSSSADGVRFRAPPGAGARNLLPPERESPPEPLPIRVLIRRKDPPPPPPTRAHTSPAVSGGSS